MRRSYLRVVPIAAMLCRVTSAGAQQCDRPDIIDALPADGATNVPVNARLIAHYDLRAEYLGEAVLFGRVGDELAEIPAFFNENEGLVEATPDAPLEPGEHYRVEWPRLRGVSTASLGSGMKLEFTAGDVVDSEPPRFDGIVGLTWGVDRDRDDCLDRRNERLRFDLDLAPVSDDGGEDSLSLIVFQTEGPDVDPSSAATPIQVRALTGSESTTIRLPVDDAEGRVCFAAIVRDLGGLVSASGSREECVTTRRPPFFYGCAIASPGTARRGAAPLALIALLGLTRRRVRRPRER